MKTIIAAVFSCVACLSISDAQASCTANLLQGGNLASAIASLTPPAVLCLQSGSTPYVINNTITLPSNVTIMGTGTNPILPASETVIQSASTLTGPMFSIPATSSYVSIEKLKLVGNTNQLTNLSATNVSIDGADHVVISKDWFSGASRMNLAISDADAITVSGTLFDSMGFQSGAQGAIWVNDSNDVNIQNAHITGRDNGPGGDGGIDCYGSSNVVINQSNITRSGESAIYTSDAGGSACDGIKITNNIVQYSDEWGIDIDGANAALIDHNDVWYANWGGISLWDTSSSVIQNNNLVDNNQGGTSYCNGINIHGTNVGNTFISNTGGSCTY